REAAQQTALRDIPPPDDAVRGGRRQCAAIGGEDGIIHIALMTIESADEVAAAGVPQRRRTVPAGGDYRLADRTEAQRHDAAGMRLDHADRVRLAEAPEDQLAIV